MASNRKEPVAGRGEDPEHEPTRASGVEHPTALLTGTRNAFRSPEPSSLPGAGPVRRSTPQQFQRETNIALVLRALRDEGPSSRSDLAARIGIDRSTMTSIAAELLRVGLLQETVGAHPGGRGGRRPVLLDLDGTRVLTGGMELGEQGIRWSICSLRGEVLASGRVPRRGTGDVRDWTEHAFDQALAGMSRWRDETYPQSMLAGVGVGVPGVVDPLTRTLRDSVVLGARDLPLGSIWDHASAGHDVRDGSVPLMVDNDANCCAWNVAEEEPELTTIVVQLNLHRRPDGGLRDSLAGIGLSFVLDGRVYYGSSHAAGELRGYRWRVGDPDQLGLVATSGRGGPGLEEVTGELLRNLGVIASVLDPGRLILAGEIAGHETMVRRQLHGELAASSLAPLYEAGVVEVAEAHQYPVCDGAARMVLSDLFAIPSVDHTGAASPSWHDVLDRLDRTLAPG